MSWGCGLSSVMTRDYNLGRGELPDPRGDPLEDCDQAQRGEQDDASGEEHTEADQRERPLGRDAEERGDERAGPRPGRREGDCHEEDEHPRSQPLEPPPLSAYLPSAVPLGEVTNSAREPPQKRDEPREAQEEKRYREQVPHHGEKVCRQGIEPQGKGERKPAPQFGDRGRGQQKHLSHRTQVHGLIMPRRGPWEGALSSVGLTAWSRATGGLDRCACTIR